MVKQTIYRTVIEIEVLSEEPFEFNNLIDVHEAITFGDCSGITTVQKTETLVGLAAVEAITAQGSDPEFLNMDDKGNKIN